MIGRTSGEIIAVRPLRDGVIADSGSPSHAAVFYARRTRAVRRAISHQSGHLRALRRHRGGEALCGNGSPQSRCVTPSSLRSRWPPRWERSLQ